MENRTPTDDIEILIRAVDNLVRITDHLLADDYTAEMLMSFYEELGRCARAKSKIQEKYQK